MATLKNLVDETTNIKNELKTCYTNLKNNLMEKGIDCSSSDKLQNLISKIKKFDKYVEDYDIYNAGNTFNSITGGYQRYPSSSSYEDRIVFESSRILITVPSGASKVGVRTVNKINLTHYNLVSVSYKNVSNAPIMYIDILNDNLEVVSSSSFFDSPLNTTFEFDVNVTRLNGEFYIFVYAGQTTSTSIKKMQIDKISVLK